MNKLEVVKRGPRRTKLIIDGTRCEIDHATHRGFWRICELRGWTPQQTFDYMMASRYDYPWRQLVGRLGGWMIRRAIIEDERLGQLKVTRMGDDELRCYRQREGMCFTSFITLPRRLWEKYAHVERGAVHNEGGELLYHLT